MNDKLSFREAGPKNFTASNINWEKSSHRRTVAACLVQAVVLLGKESNPTSETISAAAQGWWKELGFSLVQVIKDTADSSVFGAVFASHLRAPPPSPHLVVAFRGSKDLTDMKLNVKLIGNNLHRTTRFGIAVDRVEDVVYRAPRHSRIWLAGHSLGATLAMAGGRHMAMKGVRLESFLFNPPYPVAPIEMLSHNDVKSVLRWVSVVAKAVLFEFMTEEQQQLSQRECMNSFLALSEWIPNLFVNADDLICMQYKGYFERMEEGSGRRRMFSMSDLFLRAMKKESQTVHLIPSAVLSVSTSSLHLNSIDKLIEAHGLEQWWNLDLKLVSEKTYKFN